VRKIAGDTGKYYAQIAQDEETYEKTRLNDERKRKEIELFISKFRAKAQLVGLVQSRIKTLAKMEKREKLEKLAALDFSFFYRPYHGKYALDACDLSFSYEPGRPLVRDFSLSIGSGDRVCVIGQNGRGKTTLLKLFAGVLRPQHGEVTRPLNVSAGYFEQSYIAGLDESNTVLEEITKAEPEGDPRRARAICGAMMFTQDEALKKIAVLSGGEKSRVVLGKIIASPVNLLLLDEPSNHLDMESNDALLAAIDNFEGAVVMVTHNEMFLDALAERLVVFQARGPMVYEGGYQRFLDRVGWTEEKDLPKEKTDPLPLPAEPERANPKEKRRQRSAVLTERARALKPLETKIAGLEAAITTKERELEELNQAVVEAGRAKRGLEIVEISKAMHRLKEDIEILYKSLEARSEEHRKVKSKYDRELAGLAD
jgi:ATP-binding cassette subfamily F protein 3